jgi:SAM-dependent methyltransferase
MPGFKGRDKKGKGQDKRGDIRGQTRQTQHRQSKEKAKRRDPTVEELTQCEKQILINRQVKGLNKKTADAQKSGEDYRDAVDNLDKSFKGVLPESQRIYMAETYDLFAPRYIQYMNITGHHAAMKEILLILGRNMQFPLIDVSAGPGLIAEHIFKKFILSALTAQTSNKLRADKKPDAFRLIALDALVDEMEMRPTTELPIHSEKTPLMVINDISEGMIKLAKKRFRDLAENICSVLKGKPKKKLREQIFEFFERNIVFKQAAIEDLPAIYGNESFACVFCSQTMHVTPHKEAVLTAISRLLMPGGKFKSIEEFPFQTSSIPGYQDIMTRLAGSVDPIEGKITYQNMVESTIENYRKNGNVIPKQLLHYVDGSEVRVWVRGPNPKQDKHPMYGFEFEKKGSLYMAKPPEFWIP